MERRPRKEWGEIGRSQELGREFHELEISDALAQVIRAAEGKEGELVEGLSPDDLVGYCCRDVTDEIRARGKSPAEEVGNLIDAQIEALHAARAIGGIVALLVLILVAAVAAVLSL